MEDLTRARALGLLRRAVNERGADYAYPGKAGRPGKLLDDTGKLLTDDWHLLGECRYFTEGGAPACIVGLALSYLGVTARDFERHEGHSVSVISVVDDVRLGGEARTALRVAQAQQDMGRTWGEALEAAAAR